jgi:hypothetical protein
MMWKRVATIAVVAVLGAALLVGGVYIVLWPDEAHADGQRNGRGSGARTETAYECSHEGAGSGGNRSTCDDECGAERECETHLSAGQSRGYGLLERDSRGQGGRGNGGNAGGRGNGRSGQSLSLNWLTIEGHVVEADHELLIETADGQMLEVHTGPEWYWDENGYVVDVGDEVRIEGYYHDGEFEAGQIENLSTGQLILLRDTDGRPLWAGRGRKGHS